MDVKLDAWNSRALWLFDPTPPPPTRKKNRKKKKKKKRKEKSMQSPVKKIKKAAGMRWKLLSVKHKIEIS